ncbi:MAG: hypothetical protein M1829_001110 [Trizodia sp. TS-e1964]|nr:MAG: hypothetical protein M1829_001110 [Trizodia sp. TS-e1964]
MWSIVSPSIAALSLSSILFSPLAVAQTFTNCNPLTSGNCPPDPALGKAAVIDFTKGSVDSFSALGTPTYDGNGVSFTVAKPGDSPQIVSKFYIMFGRVDITLKAAPGSGIVSSAVLQSDDLDEIDWEWLGADSSQVQTNYFGKGITGSYNRGAFHPNPGNQASFKTYTVDWTANQIVWSIDGTSVRSLLPADAAGQYPQTPMQLKVGAWSGGDSTNSPGTIQWAHGPTVYSNGPFSMQVKSIAVTDYSTGTLYKYSGSDGTWQSIVAEGGKVNSGSSAPPPAPAASSSLSSQSTAAPSTAPAPAVTSTVPLVPPAFGGTHRETTTLSMPSGYPWIANPSTLQTTTIPTTYPGLPSGWTVSSSGKLIPASSASVSVYPFT